MIIIMKIFNKKNNSSKKEKGFTLLFAVLVSVLVLSVGASIISVALKQSILSSTGRESQFAFYAANTGLECALFLDLNPGYYGLGPNVKIFPYQGSDTDQVAISPSQQADVKCGITSIWTGDEDSSYPEIAWTEALVANSSEDTHAFQFAIRNDIDTGSGVPSVNDLEYCVEVVVTKASTTGQLITTISSQGLNSCDPDNDPRAVQRGLLMRYTN